MRTLYQQRAPADSRELDGQSLAALYDEYSGTIYRYVRYRLNDDHVAEDIASEVFLSLLEALRRGQGPKTDVRAWLMATASHRVADHLRRSYRRPTDAIPEDLPDRTPPPAEQYDLRQRTRDFKVAYARLTHEQQEVVALRFGEGYSLEETAVAMKKNANAIKALQFRALQTLQHHLDQEGST